MSEETRQLQYTGIKKSIRGKDTMLTILLACLQS